MAVAIFHLALDLLSRMHVTQEQDTKSPSQTTTKGDSTAIPNYVFSQTFLALVKNQKFRCNRSYHILFVDSFFRDLHNPNTRSRDTSAKKEKRKKEQSKSLTH